MTRWDLTIQPRTLLLLSLLEEIEDVCVPAPPVELGLHPQTLHEVRWQA